MDTVVEALHFEADDALQNNMYERVEGLTKIFDRIENCRVILKVEKNDDGKDKIVEVILNVPQSRLFAKDQAETFELAADLVISELKEQLRRYKEKMEER